jgi:hypothetical protein
LKIVAEIAKCPVTIDAIEGFSNFAKNSAAEKLVLLTPSKFDELESDVEEKLETGKIEVIKSYLVAAFSNTTTSSQAKKEYENIRDIVSPNMLIKELPNFAKQIVPEDFKVIVSEQKIDAWQLLEEAVYCTFSYGFGYSVRQLGKEALFKNEPEGVVTTGGVNQFALIYDCKSSSAKYTMTADDERTYIGYITKKKKEVENLNHCELKYFVIVSPEFGGDTKLRRLNILKETQVLLVLIRGETLKRLGVWAAKLPPDLKSLIDLPALLTRDDILDDQTVDKFINEFDKIYQTRY